LSIALEGISKRFGEFSALRDINLAAQPGEFLALLGPSGSGKTTLLRIMAGLEFPDTGRVRFEDKDVTGLRIADRRIGFVFQHYALFRHMSVAENIGFGLSVKKRRERPSRKAIAARVEELLDLVQLAGLGGRFPAQLSGGQRQRVALARALAVDPKLLLLDEPFGALDAKVRKELRRWLRDLHDRMGLTSVFVTHDQEEALELADRVVVMDHGVIEQIAAPATIYDEPASPFVFDFVGASNRVPITVAGGRVMFRDRAIAVAPPAAAPGAAAMFFRPHDVELADDPAAGLSVTVVLVHPRGGTRYAEATLDGAGTTIEFALPAGVPVATGETLSIRPTRLRLFPC